MYQNKNNFMHNISKSIFFTIAALFILLHLACCGGGTVGSGDTNSTISGKILTRAGDPYIGSTITHAQTGASDATDEQGSFVLQTKLSSETPELFIDKDGVSSSIKLDNFNPEQKNIEVLIIVNEKTGIVDSVQITNLNVDPTPTSNTHTQKLLGQVKSKNGKVLENVSVRINGQSNAVRSNSNGRFTIKTLAKKSTVRLDLTYNKLKGSVTISGLPTDRDSTVEFIITLTIVSSQPSPGHPDKLRLELDIEGVEVR